MYDEAAVMPGKGVVIVPDWSGVDEYERWRADALALEGYTGAWGAGGVRCTFGFSKMNGLRPI